MMKLFPALAFILFSATAAHAQSPAAAVAPAANAAAAPAINGAPPAANALAGSAPVAAGAPGTVAVNAAMPAGLSPEEMKQTFTGSFFLTPLEISAIEQALQGRVVSGKLDRRSAVARQIRVAGVFYRSPSDWIVWMNNHKITPKDRLPEIIDINVKRSSNVSLKWYDATSNRILLITMRPHQTYDIPTGILLPQ
jgi:DNA-binding transcriptional regulator YdaS (Cro superfamily)